MVAQRRKPEDTADGCRALAQADHDRAAEIDNAHMRGSLERSAETWTSRASLLDRLEGSFNARAAAYARDQDKRAAEGTDDGTGPIEPGDAQEGESRPGPKGARPRITGLSTTPDRKGGDED